MMLYIKKHTQRLLFFMRIKALFVHLLLYNCKLEPSGLSFFCQCLHKTQSKHDNVLLNLALLRLGAQRNTSN